MHDVRPSECGVTAAGRVAKMLNLKSSTAERWLAQVDADLPSVLVDHAHCEKKAAGTAMSLMFAYPGGPICAANWPTSSWKNSTISARCSTCSSRGRFRCASQRPSNYGRQLNELVRPQDPGRGIDRILIARLIEARSCERFALAARSRGRSRAGRVLR